MVLYYWLTKKLFHNGSNVYFDQSSANWHKCYSETIEQHL